LSGCSGYTEDWKINAVALGDGKDKERAWRFGITKKPIDPAKQTNDERKIGYGIKNQLQSITPDRRMTQWHQPSTQARLRV
jgi:hypothetical protein